MIAGEVVDRFWLLYLIWPAGVLGAAWLAVLGYGKAQGYRIRRYAWAPVVAVVITGAVAVSGLPAGANLWLSRGACFFSTGGFVDRSGWVYAPSGAPAPPDDRYTLRRHSGDWYRFEVRF